ncbi:tail fiber assembly protein, partial [Escherichia coli]|uniref:tail fiber assembly protein n=1 Tax=Escherichia coli TaxID=562 RepID=UPI000A6D067A
PSSPEGGCSRYVQTVVGLEIATEEETSLLEVWKKYRVLLNRVNTTTAPDIEWPVAPIG